MLPLKRYSYAWAVRHCIETGNITGTYVYARLAAHQAHQFIRKPTLENDAAWRLSEMTRILLLAGNYTELQARRLAEEVLGE